MLKRPATVLIVLTALGATLFAWPRYAWALDLGKLLDNVESDNVKRRSWRPLFGRNPAEIAIFEFQSNGTAEGA